MSASPTVATAAAPQPREPRRLGIQARLLLLVLVAALPVFLINVWDGYEARRVQRADLEAQAIRAARLIGAEQDRSFENARNILASVLLAPSATAAGETCDTFLGRLANRFPQLSALLILDPAGRVGCASTPALADLNLSDRDYFQQTMTRKAFAIGSVIQSARTGRWIVGLGLPALDAAGNVTAVAVTGLDLQRLSEDVQAETLPAGSDVLIVNDERVVLAEEPQVVAPGTTLQWPFDLASQTARRGAFLASGPDGVERIYGYSRLRQTDPLYVAVGLPTAPFFAAADQIFLRQILLLCAIFGVAAGVAWAIGEWSIRRPLAELQRAVDRLSTGDFDTRGQNRSAVPEFARLRQRFDRMARRLKRHQDQLAESNAELAKAVADRENLLREMNHRVKNHLQLVSSLLGLQSGTTADTSVRRVLEEAQNRVRTLARTHERLYRTASASNVEFASYLRELCADLGQTTGGGPAKTVCHVEAEPAELSVDQVIPLALIVNELYTNAVKYAHPNGEPGRIDVRFASDASGRYRLDVGDDGVGLPPDFDPAHSPSLGMRIVAGLVSQLGAELHIGRDAPGAHFAVVLPA